MGLRPYLPRDNHRSYCFVELCPILRLAGRTLSFSSFRLFCEDIEIRSFGLLGLLVFFSKTLILGHFVFSSKTLYHGRK